MADPTAPRPGEKPKAEDITWLIEHVKRLERMVLGTGMAQVSLPGGIAAMSLPDKKEGPGIVLELPTSITLDDANNRIVIKKRKFRMYPAGPETESYIATEDC
jgi:hypothetical protein